jgi:enoyl-CoA hydratase/carnithine racemase
LEDNVADEISLSTDGAIGQIRIDRPAKKNALTTGMYAVMAEALQTYADDDAIRAVTISGGADFTAGNDLQDFIMASMSGASFGDLPVLRFLERLQAFEKPIVAAVRGVAVGIGTTMLLHCDAVVAGRGARFRLPFAQLGLVPEAGSSMLLPLTIGRARASWLLLSGDFFGADDALAMGMLTKVTADNQTDPTAHEMAEQLAALPPTALRESKRLIKSHWAAAVKAQMAEEAAAFEARLTSEEFRTAAMKLMAK